MSDHGVRSAIPEIFTDSSSPREFRIAQFPVSFEFLPGSVTAAPNLSGSIESWHDGAGRVLRSRVPHTFSSGAPVTWAGTFVEYDILGRMTRQSVPTEVESSFAAAGDDYARGFIWNYQEYDWMGRTTRTIPSDSTGSDGKDTLISYAGCGCAGGLETTIQGPLVPRTDTSGDARRVQKSYADILGRSFKSETFEWNGSTVYSTVLQSFDGADRPIRTRQYAGTTSSTTYQDTTASFDGHGLLYQSHRPEQRDSSNNLKYTTYTYNPDGSILTMTDGRGVITNYTYSSRGLVTDIAWNVGSTGVTDVDDVEFAYDNLGNRTSMTDGLGAVSYSYDSLSRMTNETRVFSDTLSDKPSGDYDLDYTYHIGGQLKSITDPWEEQINYDLDIAGRLDEVVGSASFGGITTYANNPEYRAWGGLKHLEYGNGIEADVTFDNGLRPLTYDLQKTGNDPVMQKTYQYYPDNSLKFVGDELNGIFDRGQTFDHQGRVKEGKSSTEASGTTVTTDLDTNLPYRQSYSFNAFNNMTQRNNLHWGTDWLPYSGSFNLNYTYANNRVTNANWVYDADGRVTQTSGPDEFSSISYDARGLLRSLTSYHPTNTIRHYDGNGGEAKRERSVWVDNETPPNYGEWEDQDDEYFIRSTVLGGAVVSEVGPTGKKKQTFVYAGGAKIARQTEHVYNSTLYKNVHFSHTDPSGMSSRLSYSNGAALTGESFEDRPTEADPMGGNMGLADPYVEEPPAPPEPAPDFPAFSITDADPVYVNGLPVSMTVDGIRLIGPVANALMLSAVVQCPNNDCGPRQARNNRTGETVLTSPFAANNTGTSGFWVPETGTGVCVGNDCESGITSWRWESIESRTYDCSVQILVNVGSEVQDFSTDGAVSNYPYVNKEVVQDFRAAVQAVNAGAATIQGNAGGGFAWGFSELFRPYDVQVDYWNKYQANLNADAKKRSRPYPNIVLAAKPGAYPGSSNHGAGFSFDMPAVVRNSLLVSGPYKGKTVQDVFESFGFLHNQPGDPPHFNYKTKPTAAQKLEAQDYFKNCLP